MPEKRDAIVAALTRKGFRKDDSHHIFLVYVRKDGKTSTRRTKVSKGTKHKDVSDVLLSAMSKQLGLTNKQFQELVDCHMSRDEYEKAVSP